jgi:hypothetical protein
MAQDRHPPRRWDRTGNPHADDRVLRRGRLPFRVSSFGVAIDLHGTAPTDETLAACRAADAVLLATVDGPKWDTTDPKASPPEQGLLGLRKGLGLYANLRLVRPLQVLYEASPLRRDLDRGDRKRPARTLRRASRITPGEYYERMVTSSKIPLGRVGRPQSLRTSARSCCPSVPPTSPGGPSTWMAGSARWFRDGLRRWRRLRTCRSRTARRSSTRGLRARR